MKNKWLNILIYESLPIVMCVFVYSSIVFTFTDFVVSESILEDVIVMIGLMLVYGRADSYVMQFKQ